MALVLDLYRQGKEFVAVFDHHDDLVVFVGEGENSELSFYQVKSSSELTWTPKRLARRSSNGELPKSIIGKAYYNVAQFGPEIRRASILSNRPLSATLSSASNAALHDGELSVADLSAADQEPLINSLEADFPGGFDKAHAPLLTFERVPFDLESYRTTVLGRIVKLLEELHPDFVAVSSPFYEALLTAAGECTGNKIKSATVEELRKRVSLDHEQISRLVVRVQSRAKNLVEWWTSVSDELAADGKRALQIQRVKNRCIAYVNARRAGERVAARTSEAIGEAIVKAALGDMDSVLEAAVTLKAHGLIEPSSELYDLQAAMIVELMETMT
ncbi:dsDNA nuclease domain-containing protein [Rhizobium sp. 16-449-1b]|uniref:dsDNA nuclease domain-containing protein n=1 Tax=Rhizobium sp. 16-449-1b TaxID=2819989 RepID=UPI001FFE2D04|nr:dsDNA nuclease domain-containing protein [Rhizobium sp. 16-449-1b]